MSSEQFEITRGSVSAFRFACLKNQFFEFLADLGRVVNVLEEG